MDELTEYLKSNYYYNEYELEAILNKKIIINQNHIENINLRDYHDHWYFNIIKLFEKYGYVFTNDDYILLINRCGNVMTYISDDRLTDEICKTTVQHNGHVLQFVPENKKTDEICKIAVAKNKLALEYVPANKQHLFIKK